MSRICPECNWVWPKPTGPCPQCGSDAAPEVDLARRPTEGTEKAPLKMPWHLKLLVAALVIYLAFRIVQMVGWVT